MPVPRISLPNPHNRKPSLSSKLHTEAASPDRDRQPVPSIPAHHLERQGSTNSLEHAPPVKPASVVNGLPPPPPPLKRDASGRYIESDGLRSSSKPVATSHDSGYVSQCSDTKSPVAPFRSMFPIYDAAVPLQQQAYYPARPLQVRQASYESIPDNTSHLGMTPIDRHLGRRAVPSSVYTAVPPTPFLRPSQQKDLELLWEATHGMEPEARISTYNLELIRVEEAIFCLGSSPKTPFYQLTTFDTNELSLSKIHPRRPTKRIDVSLNSIEDASRRMTPGDGLVSFIFPKMAAMLAVNQTAKLAKAHDLAPTHRDEIQASAIRRAAEQEACSLKWNLQGQNYSLEHPALGRRAKELAAFNFTMSPASTSGSAPRDTATHALDILVSSASGRSLPTITVVKPVVTDPESASTPSVPGIRMSTIPNRGDDDASLACLDFNTRLLTINAREILTHVPALFAIDSIVSAVLTVAVADLATNSIMANMEIWDPSSAALSASSPLQPPSSALRRHSAFGGSQTGSVTSHNGSIFYATLAEREAAESRTRSSSALRNNSSLHSDAKPAAHRSWFGKSKDRKPKIAKSQKVITAEFDMEKLNHYQAGSREGQKLPGPARAILSVLVGGLKAIVWLLTAVVQFFVWIVVHLTRGLTSEKF